MLSLETCLGIHMCAVLPFGNVLQSVVVVGRTKWVTWHEYLFSAKVRCASTNCLLSWTSFVRSFESGSKCTKPWFYIIVSIRAKRNSGYLLLVWYILVCFDNTYVFVPSISVHLLLRNKKLFNVSQDTGFLRFSYRWNECTVCTRESLKKRHQLLVFKCSCSWETKSRNGD